MALLQQDFLERNFLQLTQFVQSWDGVAANCTDEKKRLAAHLKALQRDEIIQNSGTEASCSEFLDVLSNLDEDKPISADQLALLRLKFEETRLRFVAATMGVSGIRSAEAPLVSKENLIDECAPLIVGRGDLISTSNEAYTVVLLPAIRSTAHISELSYGLDDIVEHTASGRDWIVDFSAVEQHPGLLLANVIFHISRLRDLQRKLFITWLRQDLISEANTRTLQKLINLTSIGGFWFSVGG